MTLTELADVIGVNIKFTYYAGQDGRWCCSFEDSAVKEGALLCYTSGNGKTPQEAMRDYINIVKGQPMVNDAYKKRKEFMVPKDISI